MAMTTTRDSLHSSYRERLLEHVFLGELLRSLWIRGVSEVEVLKPEVDAAGYDFAIQFRKWLRHIQLKSSFTKVKNRSVPVNTRLAEKPSGCVISVCFNRENLQLGPYNWLGSAPGRALPDLAPYPIGRQPRGNAAGLKALRPHIRRVPKRAFTPLDTMDQIVNRLFRV